jgi:hypothetical protein
LLQVMHRSLLPSGCITHIRAPPTPSLGMKRDLAAVVRVHVNATGANSYSADNGETDVVRLTGLRRSV